MRMPHVKFSKFYQGARHERRALEPLHHSMSQPVGSFHLFYAECDSAHVIKSTSALARFVQGTTTDVRLHSDSWL